MIRTLGLAVALSAAAPAGTQAMPDATAIRVELNRLRAEPAAYVASLRAHRGTFDSARQFLYVDPTDATVNVTREGIAAVDEAIADLAARKPLPLLASDPVLAQAAHDFVAEQGPIGAIGHRTASGLGPGDRARRRGGDIYVAETISYGPATAANVIRQLIVDDNVPGRGHRRILLSPDYRFVGIACGPHARFRTMCVLDLSAWPAGKPQAR